MKAVDFHGKQFIIKYKIDDEFDTLMAPYVGVDRGKDNIQGGLKLVYDLKYNEYDILPHLSVTERIGDRLKSLEFNTYKGYLFDDQNTDVFDMATGYFLDHIFLHCPFLETLTIREAHLADCNPIKQVNDSVQVLVLASCYIVPVVWHELYVRLPKLNCLYLCDSYFASTAYRPQVLDTCNSFQIYMPHTSFTTLFWRPGRDSSKCSKFYLKVTDKFGTSFFAGDKTRVDKSPEMDFYLSSENDDVLSLSIYCNDIANIMLDDFKIVVNPSEKNYIYRPMTAADNSNNY